MEPATIDRAVRTEHMSDHVNVSTDLQVPMLWERPVLMPLGRMGSAASGGTRSTDGCSTQYAGTS